MLGDKLLLNKENYLGFAVCLVISPTSKYFLESLQQQFKHL